jgi:hypothetical protein
MHHVVVVITDIKRAVEKGGGALLMFPFKCLMMPFASISFSVFLNSLVSRKLLIILRILNLQCRKKFAGMIESPTRLLVI